MTHWKPAVSSELVHPRVAAAVEYGVARGPWLWYEAGVIRGRKVGLRAPSEQDVPVLHAELYNDVPTRSRVSGRAWVPTRPGPRDAPYGGSESGQKRIGFSVVELSTEELAGEAMLVGVDTHSRHASLGLALRPAYRGRGLGTDIVRVLCYYGFVVRGMHRLEVATLADNVSMIGAAQRAGFTLEGTLRSAAWVMGEFLDVTLLGLLAPEYRAMSET